MNWLDLLGSWSLHKHCNPHASPHRLIATAGNHASGKPSHKSHGRWSAKVDCATRQAFHQSRNGSACCGGPVLITMLHSRVLLSRRTRHFFVDHLHCPPWLLLARRTRPDGPSNAGRLETFRVGLEGRTVLSSLGLDGAAEVV